MDITKTRFQDASFDVIICNHVLEAHYRRFQSNAGTTSHPETNGLGNPPSPSVVDALTLKPTCEDPSVTSMQAREAAFGQYDHVRIYATTDYIDRLSEAGFAVEVFNWVEQPDEFDGVENRFGLNAEESVYIARPLS